MSDLISRSALIELIQKDIEKTASFMNTAEKYDGSFEKLYGQLNALKNYKSIISDMPTAYDVEKVVKELENANEKIAKEDYCRTKYYIENDCEHKDCFKCCAEYLIDIVRKGGVE